MTWTLRAGAKSGFKVRASPLDIASDVSRPLFAEQLQEGGRRTAAALSLYSLS